MRFNPRRSIDPKAQAVHGISLEELAAEPLLADHAGKIAAYMGACSALVAHNGELLTFRSFATSSEAME